VVVGFRYKPGGDEAGWTLISQEVFVLDFKDSLDPNDWEELKLGENCYTSTVPADDNFAIAAAFIEGGPYGVGASEYVYMLGWVRPDHRTKHATVGRVLATDLVKGDMSGMTFYMNNGEWESYTDDTPQNIHILYRDCPDETTVHYHPKIHNGGEGYYTLTTTILDPYVFMRTAPRPQGPWTEPEPIYEIPLFDDKAQKVKKK